MNKKDMEIWLNAVKDVKPLKASKQTVYHPNKKVFVKENIFNPVLDLHGITIHDAYYIVHNHIDKAIEKGFKYITVITGRSGQINAEFSKWVSSDPKVRKVSEINSGGAYEVYLKRK